VTEELTPIEGCECSCNDTPLDKIKKQVAHYERQAELTPDEQESLATALQVIAVIEELAKQGQELELEEE
jgi:hypothetical protein